MEHHTRNEVLKKQHMSDFLFLKLKLSIVTLLFIQLIINTTAPSKTHTYIS